MKTCKALIVALLFAPAAALAGPYPGSLRAHGHSGPGDGGLLSNVNITGHVHLTATTTPYFELTAGTTDVYLAVPGGLSGSPLQLKMGDPKLSTSTLRGLEMKTDGTDSLAIRATQTNDSATAGDVGEATSTIKDRSSAISLTSGITANITSFYLAPGDWNVWLACGMAVAGGTPASTKLTCGGTSLSASLPGVASTADMFANGIVRQEMYGAALAASTADDISATFFTHASLLLGATYYLVGQATYGSGTVSAYGSMYARRAR